MAKLIAGIIIGFIMCVDAGMVVFCVWYEHQHPESLNSHSSGESHDEVIYENTDCL